MKITVVIHIKAEAEVSRAGLRGTRDGGAHARRQTRIRA